MGATPHTPGPWRAGYGSQAERGEFMIVRAEEIDGQPYIATCYSGSVVGSHEANARLIAAAPELLEVCRGLVREAEDTFIDPEEMSSEFVALWKAAKVAIAKATEVHPEDH